MTVGEDWTRQAALRMLAEATSDEEGYEEIAAMLESSAQYIDDMETQLEVMELRFLIFTKVLVDRIGADAVREVTLEAQDQDPSMSREEKDFLVQVADQVEQFLKRDLS